MHSTLPISKTAALTAAIMLTLASGCAVDAVDSDGNGDDELGCAAASSYAAAIDQEAEQFVDEEGDTIIELFAVLEDDPLNELEISLFDGAGVFENQNLGPGTYQIAGPETNYDDCGMCVAMYGDVDPETDLERQFMMAQSGTVVVDSTDGRLSGSLRDVVLVEVNPATNIPVADGCQTTIPALDFDASIEAGTP